MPIVGLINTLSNILHEPVVDATSLVGFFDFTLDPMQFATTGGADSTQPKDSYLISAAVQGQLGLKLEKGKAQLEITIIDHAERPSAN